MPKHDEVAISDEELEAAVLADIFARAQQQQIGRVWDRGAPGTYWIDSTGTYLVYVRRVSTAHG